MILGALLLPGLSFLICKMGTKTSGHHLLKPPDEISPGEQDSNDVIHKSQWAHAGRGNWGGTRGLSLPLALPGLMPYPGDHGSSVTVPR